MSYIMGFVTPVATARKADFIDHARRAAAIIRDLGATRVVDGWGEDVPAGQVTDFARAVQLREGETVSFGWIEFPDKATADRFVVAMRHDPRMEALGDLPFDGQRMIFGGFGVVSEG